MFFYKGILKKIEILDIYFNLLIINTLLLLLHFYKRKVF